MKPTYNTIFNSAKVLGLSALLAFSSNSFSTEVKSVIDSFSHVKDTSYGTPRMSLTDTTAGGKTTAKANVQDGFIQVKGEILPPRGQPGWSSLVLPLSPMGQTLDASKFDGIRLLVKLNKGSLSLSANSADVTNYDYHAAQVIVKPDGNFHEVKIPFDSMKRMWSEQTALNTQTLNSLSIVAFGLQKSSYDFEVDEVSFY